MGDIYDFLVYSALIDRLIQSEDFDGMGYYRRVAVTAGAGVMVGDGKNVPTPYDIHRHWDAINDLGRPEEYYKDSASIAPMFKGSGISPQNQSKGKRQ